MPASATRRVMSASTPDRSSTSTTATSRSRLTTTCVIPSACFAVSACGTRMWSSTRSPVPRHVAAARLTPASLTAAAMRASAPGSFSISITRSNGTAASWQIEARQNGHVMFGLEGRVAVVTGATGVLGGAVARGLRDAGASVAVLARSRDRLEAIAGELDGLVLQADVLGVSSLERSRDEILDRFGRIDVLVNAAGGNVAGATVDSFFDLTAKALDDVLALNLMGTALPSRIFGAHIGDGGSIVNLSSMAADRALTRVAGYGAAKAAVESLTRSLAVELAPRAVRVNAVAPGFFVSEQNRALLF